MSYVVYRADREYLLAPDETLETDLGILTIPEDITAGDTVETHLGESFDVRDLRPPDYFEHFERTGAPMMPRDVGLILGQTGIGTGDRVLDAGTGTGILAAYCGHAGAAVTTYEIDPDFAEVARENMAMADVTDQVTVQTGDVSEAIAPDDGPFDAITLDTADAPTVVELAPDLLASGGVLAVYSPFLEDAREVVDRARECNLTDIETTETIQRAMDFDDRGSRPTTSGVGHTGYITVARQS